MCLHAHGHHVLLNLRGKNVEAGSQEITHRTVKDSKRVVKVARRPKHLPSLEPPTNLMHGMQRPKSSKKVLAFKRQGNLIRAVPIDRITEQPVNDLLLNNMKHENINMKSDDNLVTEDEIVPQSPSANKNFGSITFRADGSINIKLVDDTVPAADGEESSREIGEIRDDTQDDTTMSTIRSLVEAGKQVTKWAMDEMANQKPKGILGLSQ